MKTSLPVSVLLLATLVCCCRLNAQTYDTNNVMVQPFVGSGFYGHVNGEGALTMFYQPTSIVTDSTGNFYVWDSSNYRIRKITPAGVVTTFAGGGTVAPPGYGTNVSFEFWTGTLVMDHSDNLWLMKTYTSSFNLFRIGMDGLVFPVFLNGVSPAGICVDSKNNLYISSSDHRIYRYQTNGNLEVFVGSGNFGAVDGNGIFNSFSNPTVLTADAADNLYVWDSGNFLIRKVDQNRNVTTIAGMKNYSTEQDGVGTNAAFGSIYGMCTDNAGNVYFSSGYAFSSVGSSIRKINANREVTTLAGSFSQIGYVNGPGEQALFSQASGLCLSQGAIFVSDSGNHRIRKITFDAAMEPVLPADLELNTYAGLRINGVVGRTYRVESSGDMNAWTTETTLVLPRTPYLWIDENSVNGKKFYRACVLP